ncbi:hypothetical protein DIPPA_05455 [Diplonema papillatum]|nr:hypothetical protein DIPPA_05455 [Diplonema papillatum]
MEDALSKFRELPYGSFQFTHSKELVLMLKDAPDEVKRAVKTGKVRGHSVTRVIDSLSVGGRPITEPEFRDLTARVTGTETEDWEKKPLQRLILLLTVIHDRVELDVFRQLLEEPERMPRTPGVAPQEAAVDEPEALVADTPKQHPRVRIDLTSLAPEGGQQTPRGGQDGPKDLKPPHLGFDESEGDEENGPVDEAIVRFVWSTLGSTSPLTAATYIERLCRELHNRGVRGLRTERLIKTKKALRRMGSLLRPQQADGLKPEDAKELVRRLLREGQETAAALAAIAWISRCRVSDLRFMTDEDWHELGPGDTPEEETEVEFFAKEKSSRKWRPPIFLPHGSLTAVAVRFWRQRRKQKKLGLPFGGDTGVYEKLKREVKKGMQGSKWLHAFRRGSIQEIEKQGVPRTALQELLRHSSAETTIRYLNSTNVARRKAETEMLRTLQ